ncbi:MAG: amidohydrolase [Planctomycetes bacterium]|jgi:hypothetical protein|nr:amidohydrolase [Planctomycetota bacterium]MDP6409988.1 amidohydrolase family protein [Planctomycetota bacterium]
MTTTPRRSQRTFTRREFHRQLAGAAALGVTSASCVQPGVSSRGSAGRPSGRFIDIHTHLGQQWSARGALTVPYLLDWMDEHEVAQAVVLPLISPESWAHPVTTDYVLEKTAGHRERLIPFCSIDPRTVNLGSQQARLDLLGRYKDAGARGFGEHKPGVAIDDPRNVDLFRACAEVGLPVLFHLDTLRNFDAPGLPGLESVLKTVPECTFIAHAQGWWANISGDVTQAQMQQYPKAPVAPGGAVERLLTSFPNLYGDLSAGSGANAISRDLIFGREFVLRHATQLLFGTDVLRPEQEVAQFDLYAGLDLPADVEALVYRDNARRVLEP